MWKNWTQACIWYFLLEPGPQSGTWPCQLLMRWRHLVNLVNGLKQLGMDLLAGRGGEGAGSQVAPWTQVNGKPVLSSKDGKPREFSSLAKSRITLK